MKPKFFHTIRIGHFQYNFRLTVKAGNWRIYILRRIQESTFPITPSTCHMLTDEYNHQYVCWTDPITSIDHARHIADQWAYGYHHYVHTGASFVFR